MPFGVVRASPLRTRREPIMVKEASSFFAIALVLFIGAYVYIYSQGGNPYHLLNSIHAVQTLDYHALARQDALNVGLNPDLFVTQIQVESGFNPDIISPAGAIGIAQIMPSTAAGWNVDPHDPVASLSAAASAMAHYDVTYQNYDKALACYNAGCGALDKAVSNCGANWRRCVPAETNRYIHAITGD